MRESAPSEHRQETDYIYVSIVCFLVFGIGPLGIAELGLQRLLLQPTGSVLFGPTPVGKMMILVPTILIGLLVSFVAARPITRLIRRGLGMPEITPPFPVAPWARLRWQSMDWRRAGGVVGVTLILVAAKGFVSYFYVTESRILVRSPQEFSMRQYEWTDVTAVRVRCKFSKMTKRQNGLRYVLRMSDGYELDWSPALDAATQKMRTAYAARLAEVIRSRLNAAPGIRYEFDVSRDGLVHLGENRGPVLPDALREQVLTHGGILR